MRVSVTCTESIRDYLVNGLPTEVEIPDYVVEAVNWLFDHNSLFLGKQEFFEEVYTFLGRVFKPADLASDKRTQITALAVSLWRQHKNDWKAKKSDVVGE